MGVVGCEDEDEAAATVFGKYDADQDMRGTASFEHAGDPEDTKARAGLRRPRQLAPHAPPPRPRAPP